MRVRNGKKEKNPPKNQPLLIISRLLIYGALQIGKSKEKFIRSELSRQLWITDRI